MLQKYSYVSGKSKFNIIPSQFNYSLYFRDSTMILRIHARATELGGGGELMELTFLVEIQFYGWFSELLNPACRHKTRWFEAGDPDPQRKPPSFAAVTSTCKTADQAHSQPAWSVLAEQTFTSAGMFFWRSMIPSYLSTLCPCGAKRWHKTGPGQRTGARGILAGTWQTTGFESTRQVVWIPQWLDPGGFKY